MEQPLAAKLGYVFSQPELLEQALTHPSINAEGGDTRPNNQRLEFLGDAVLSLVLARWLFDAFPEEREGFLTRAQSTLARGSTLAAIARELNLSEHLIVSEGERLTGGHQRPGALEDACEAIIGAVYLDGGLDAAAGVIERVFGDLQGRVQAAFAHENPKGRLQELMQSRKPGIMLAYEIVSQSGPDHAKSFRAEVRVDGETLGAGEGPSKKVAEERAARAALRSGESASGARES